MVKDKETLILGAGAGVGVIQTVVFKEYVDPQFGNFPVIGDMLPAPWGRWSTFGNILIGGALFGLTQFTSIIANKSYQANSFLKMYGITTLVGGLVNGLFPGGATASAGLRLRRPTARAAPIARVARTNSRNLTQTGIPAAKVVA